MKLQIKFVDFSDFQNTIDQWTWWCPQSNLFYWKQNWSDDNYFFEKSSEIIDKSAPYM